MFNSVWLNLLANKYILRKSRAFSIVIGCILLFEGEKDWSCFRCFIVSGIASSSSFITWGNLSLWLFMLEREMGGFCSFLIVLMVVLRILRGIGGWFVLSEDSEKVLLILLGEWLLGIGENGLV